MAGHSFHFITKRDNKLTFHYYFPLSILAIWDYFNCINKHLETKSEFGCVLIRLILYSFGAINVFCISMAIDRISFRTKKFTGVSLKKKKKKTVRQCVTLFWLETPRINGWVSKKNDATIQGTAFIQEKCLGKHPKEACDGTYCERHKTK